MGGSKSYFHDFILSLFIYVSLYWYKCPARDLNPYAFAPVSKTGMSASCISGAYMRELGLEPRIKWFWVIHVCRCIIPAWCAQRDLNSQEFSFRCRLKTLRMPVPPWAHIFILFSCKIHNRSLSRNIFFLLISSRHGSRTHYLTGYEPGMIIRFTLLQTLTTGFEPATFRLTAGRSTIELHEIIRK